MPRGRFILERLYVDVPLRGGRPEIGAYEAGNGRCFSLVVYLLCDKLALHDKSRLIEASRTPYIDCAETVAPTVYVEETIGPHSGRQSLNVEVYIAIRCILPDVDASLLPICAGSARFVQVLVRCAVANALEILEPKAHRPVEFVDALPIVVHVGNRAIPRRIYVFAPPFHFDRTRVGIGTPADAHVRDGVFYGFAVIFIFQ